MSEYIITENQLKMAMEACLKREIPLPITNVFISGDKLPEIVRCRDCKHFASDELGDYCTLLDFEDVKSMGNGFCAWGCRK